MPPRPNLDFLRTFAVITVLIDHTALNINKHDVLGWSVSWLGVFGVYLFFVHTSLVLTWSLERRPHTLDFYVRRVFRIYPLAIIAVLVVITFHLQIAAEPFVVTTRSLFSNLLLTQNIQGQRYATGVLWSLPLEVQMYLVLPLLFLFARRERTLWPFLIIWIFACKLASSIYGSNMSNNFITVIPHFLPGIMAYIGFKHRSPRLPGFLFPALLFALCSYYEHAPSVQKGWLVCLALGLLLPFFRDIGNHFLITVSHTIAKYSYGFYLLHPFALLIAFVVLKNHSLWLKLTVEGACICVFSFLAYHLIEHPAVKLGSRVANYLQTRYGTDYRADYGLDLA